LKTRGYPPAPHGGFGFANCKFIVSVRQKLARAGERCQANNTRLLPIWIGHPEETVFVTIIGYPNLSGILLYYVHLPMAPH
jgi:hypothetical protein